MPRPGLRTKLLCYLLIWAPSAQIPCRQSSTTVVRAVVSIAFQLECSATVPVGNNDVFRKSDAVGRECGARLISNLRLVLLSRYVDGLFFLFLVTILDKSFLVDMP
jgi:hypothetical protein